MTINWDPKSHTTATTDTQSLVGILSPVSWGAMGNLCGTKLCHHVKVGETHDYLHNNVCGGIPDMLHHEIDFAGKYTIYQNITDITVKTDIQEIPFE